jgi:hypothetical protein
MTRPDSVEERMRTMDRAGGDRLLNLGSPTRYGFETEARHVLEAAGVPALLVENEQLRADVERLRGALDRIGVLAQRKFLAPDYPLNAIRDEVAAVVQAPNQTDAPEGGHDGE